MMYFKEDDSPERLVHLVLPVSAGDKKDKYKIYFQEVELYHLPAVGDSVIVEFMLGDDFAIPVVKRVWDIYGVPRLQLEQVVFSPSYDFLGIQSVERYSYEEGISYLEKMGWEKTFKL